MINVPKKYIKNIKQNKQKKPFVVYTQEEFIKQTKPLNKEEIYVSRVLSTVRPYRP